MAGRAVEADGRQASGEQGGAQLDVELAGEDHLHDVEHGRIGDPAAGDLDGRDGEPLLQVGGLGAAAVDDGDPGTAVDQRLDVAGEHGGFAGADPRLTAMR